MFEVTSYGYPESIMTFENRQIDYGPKTNNFRQWTELDYSVEDLVPLRKTRRAGDFNNYSYAGFEFTLQRHIGNYIVYNHMPSGLFVCISWISFVVPIEVIPGRMALLVTLLLVLVNIFNSTHHNEPHARGITAVSGICKSLHQTFWYFPINKWKKFLSKF